MARGKPRISLAGFRDPVRRPRFLVWTGVIVLMFAAVMIVALGVTSTRWFCSEGCHKVQDDTIEAYRHSSHSEISCMACHMPVGANPVIFLIHKAEALGELAQTVTNNYELPLNGESEVALTMKSTQCTQCHDEAKRKITPSQGIKINHTAHADKNVNCTLCHNRIAHNEDFNLKLKNPKDGKLNKKHEVFMTMTACFRCHSQYPSPTTPTGRCPACHTADFRLKPESHLAPDFYPAGHAKLAAQEESRVIEAGGASWLGGSEATAKPEAQRDTSEEDRFSGESLPKVETINECSTCHARSFCTDCHGLPMPHPADFKKTHGQVGKANPQICARCHGDVKVFCDQCHHSTALGWQIKPGVTWRKQHPQAVAALGASTCFQCHNPTFCAECHVRGGQ